MYIYKDVILEERPINIGISEKIENRNKRAIKMTPEMDTFYFANKSDEGLTVMEVWNKSLDINRIKKTKISEIEKYDVSINVNGFTIGGVKIWLTKDERSALGEDIERLKNKGETKITLFAGESIGFIDLDIEQGRIMLDAIKEYARLCYLVTKQHILNVISAQSIEEVRNIDITKDYPPQLVF